MKALVYKRLNSVVLEDRPLTLRPKAYRCHCQTQWSSRAGLNRADLETGPGQLLGHTRARFGSDRSVLFAVYIGLS
jgi:hypothetical protein